MKANRREAGHTSATSLTNTNDATKPSGCFIELDPSDVQTSYPFGLDASNAPISTVWTSHYSLATTTSPTQATLDGLIQICTLPTVQDAEQIACGASTGIVGVQFKSVDGNSCLGSDNAAQPRYEYGPLELADPTNAQDSCGVFESQLRLGYDAASGTHTISSTNTSKYLLSNSDALGTASVGYNKKFYFGNYPDTNGNSDLWRYDITPITSGATQYYVQPKPQTSCKNGACTQTESYTRGLCFSTYASDGTSQVGWYTRTRDCEYTDFQKFTIECLYISPSAPPPAPPPAPPIQPYYSTGGDCQELLTEQDCRTLAQNEGYQFFAIGNQLSEPPGCYKLSTNTPQFSFNTKTSLTIGWQCSDNSFYSCYCRHQSPPSLPPPSLPHSPIQPIDTAVTGKACTVHLTQSECQLYASNNGRNFYTVDTPSYSYGCLWIVGFSVSDAYFNANTANTNEECQVSGAAGSRCVCGVAPSPPPPLSPPIAPFVQSASDCQYGSISSAECSSEATRLGHAFFEVNDAGPYPEGCYLIDTGSVQVMQFNSATNTNTQCSQSTAFTCFCLLASPPLIPPPLPPTSPPSPPPATPVRGWVFSQQDQVNCNSVCEPLGLRCDTNLVRSDEIAGVVDSKAGLLNTLINSYNIGPPFLQCDSYVGAEWSSYPFYQAANNRCGYPVLAGGTFGYNCDSVAAAGYHRLCYCHPPLPPSSPPANPSPRLPPSPPPLGTSILLHTRQPPAGRRLADLLVTNEAGDCHGQVIAVRGAVESNSSERTLYVNTQESAHVHTYHHLNADYIPATSFAATLTIEGDVLATAVVNSVDGVNHIVINGRPVYIFSGDTDPVHVNGVAGTWEALDLNGNPDERGCFSPSPPPPIHADASCVEVSNIIHARTLAAKTGCWKYNDAAVCNTVYYYRTPDEVTACLWDGSACGQESVYCSPNRPPPALPPPQPSTPPGVHGPSPPPPHSPAAASKFGLITDGEMPANCLNHFDDAAKWTYNYEAAPTSEIERHFWNSNDKEFVPTVWTSVNLVPENGYSYTSRCYFHEMYLPTNPGNSMYGSPICNGATELIQQLTYTAQRLDTPMRYIMPYNEPWDKGSGEIDPVFYADYVFKHIATAARAHNLQLVSPTTKGNAADWFARFVARLYNNYPDDLALMTRIDLHYYKTQENKWDAGVDPVSDFVVAFPAAMVALGNTTGRGSTYWTWWANQQTYWITEHSNEQNSNYPQVSQDDTCRRISGQLPSTHGVGSVVKLNEDTRVERWAWWTTFRAPEGMRLNPRTHTPHSPLGLVVTRRHRR